MGAPKGNQFWKARTKHGRDKIFSTPEILLDACYEYFQWCEDNPLMASEVVKFQGIATLTEVPKMRAMTIRGLCLFLGTNTRTWANYKGYEAFLPIVREAEDVIYNQKFSGAAADLLNANIIARELGLSDKKEITGKDGKSLIQSEEVKKLSQEEMLKQYQDAVKS